jgi:hypothetical protein
MPFLHFAIVEQSCEALDQLRLHALRGFDSGKCLTAMDPNLRRASTEDSLWGSRSPSIFPPPPPLVPATTAAPLALPVPLPRPAAQENPQESPQEKKLEVDDDDGKSRALCKCIIPSKRIQY